MNYICVLYKPCKFYCFFLAAVPVCLSVFARWLSRPADVKSSLYWQAVMISGHFAVYMLFIFLWENRVREDDGPLIRLRELRSKAAAVFTGLQRLIQGLRRQFKETIKELQERIPVIMVLGDWFFIVVFVVMVIGYPVLCLIPFSLERMPYTEAANYISALSEDTESAEKLLSDVQCSGWYDDNDMLENPDVDKMKYLDFLYENLREEAVQKNCIALDADEIRYEDVSNWYKVFPQSR